MPQPFELTMKIEGRPDFVVVGEFSDGEHSTLRFYLKQHDELVQSKPLREGAPCSISLKWDQEAGLRVTASLPDDDTLSILLHRLRPFILKKEPASFAAASSIIGRRVKNPYVRQLLREQRELYEGRRLQQQMQIVSNDVLVNSEKVLFYWLNSHEYHRDPDKREAIDALFERMPGDLMRGIFVSMLLDKVEAIRNVALLVTVLLVKGEHLQFRARDGDSAS
jgi:hypothetical protein